MTPRPYIETCRAGTTCTGTACRVHLPAFAIPKRTHAQTQTRPYAHAHIIMHTVCTAHVRACVTAPVPCAKKNTHTLIKKATTRRANRLWQYESETHSNLFRRDGARHVLLSGCGAIGNRPTDWLLMMIMMTMKSSPVDVSHNSISLGPRIQSASPLGRRDSVHLNPVAAVHVCEHTVVSSAHAGA